MNLDELKKEARAELQKRAEEFDTLDTNLLGFMDTLIDTVALRVIENVKGKIEKTSRLEPGKDDYEHEYLLGWNAALKALKETISSKD